nr:reverse transcriptase domain-containing protein [Tanacetum cinerariifolium]
MHQRLVEIHNIKQRDGESTEEFVRRYKLECRDVKGAPKCMKISEFMHGITNPELIKRLHDKIPKSIDEMIKVTTTFLRGEVAASNRELRKSFPSWKQQNARQKQNFKKEGFRNQQSPEQKQDRSTLLTKTPREILALDKGKFKPPPSMTTPRQIEEMLKAEKPSHLIKELKQSSGKDHAKAAKNGETSGKDKPLAILMVQPWKRIAKQNITQTFVPESVISFSPLGEEDGMEGLMIIEAGMRGHFVHRMYVDGVGFSEEVIWPLGKISLLVKICDEEHSTSAWTNFMIVRSPSPYSGIIERPEVRRIQAVPSTAHGMLKFPMAGGIVTLRSSRIIPLECTMASGPGVSQPVINQVAEEKIQVAIHPEYPKQTIAMGSTLIEDGRKELCGCLPIRQKKTGQAPERSKAICEEVKKLMDADIMKEVHYHSWISNPVMVKKHDGSWRMCVDFKNLNKACPKDGYPLPEIDWKVESLYGSGAGLIITNPKRIEFTYALRFRFDATNNEAEYKALIARLRITEQTGVKNLQENVDSRLVANQVNGTYIAKEPGMVKNIEKVKNLANTFKDFFIKQVPRGENKKADALSKIASTIFVHMSKQVLVEELKEKSIYEKEVLAVVEEEARTWMTLIHERMIPEPGDTNREVLVNETFHVQTDDELTEKELKQIKADDQAIQTILLSLPEDIYAAVGSCETAQEIWLRVQQMMKGSTLEFRRRRPSCSMNGKDLLLMMGNRLTERLAKTQDPLALMENSNNPYAFPAPHQDQPSFNQNYMQQPMLNPEDITDPTTAMNMALALMAKAFKLNYSTPTNNNQRISSNPCNKQIAQPGMNMGQDSQIQMVGGNGENQFRQYAGQNVGNLNGGVGHFARNCTIRPMRRDAAYLQTQLLIALKEEAGIQLQAEEFELMDVASDLDEIEEVNTNCILMANLQQASISGTQTDKAPVYDSDGSTEVHNYENCYDNEIFNMFTQEEQYTELLKPIPEPLQVPQNDNNVISDVTSVEKSEGTVEQHSVNVEETRVLYDSLYHNLAIEVAKVNTINRKLKETNAELTTELARFKNQIKVF